MITTVRYLEGYHNNLKDLYSIISFRRITTVVV